MLKSSCTQSGWTQCAEACGRSDCHGEGKYALHCVQIQSTTKAIVVVGSCSTALCRNYREPTKMAVFVVEGRDWRKTEITPG